MGRLREAGEPMEAGVDSAVEKADWENSSAGARNLSELQLTQGDIVAAVKFARRAVEYADRSGNWGEVVKQRGKLANAEHQAGRLDEAAKLFGEAERLQQEQQRNYPLLYSGRGFAFCGLLLAQGEHAEARRRATQTLEWYAQNKQLWLLDIGLDHLTLGRAALAAALATRNSDFSEAEEQFGVAVDGLRAAGTQDHVPLGLLARAELSRHQCNFPRAERDLRDAEKIARRGEMRLHQTDCHLEWARLHLARHEPAAARDRRDKARTLVNETGYHRRDRDLAEIEQQLEAAAPKSAGN